jgi:hypothetical protein
LAKATASPFDFAERILLEKLYAPINDVCEGQLHLFCCLNSADVALKAKA